MYKLIRKDVVILFIFPFFDSGSFFFSFFVWLVLFCFFTTTQFKNIPGNLMTAAFASPDENSGELLLTHFIVLVIPYLCLAE